MVKSLEKNFLFSFPFSNFIFINMFLIIQDFMKFGHPVLTFGMIC